MTSRVSDHVSIYSPVRSYHWTRPCKVTRSSAKAFLSYLVTKNMTFDPDLHSQDAFIWSWSYYEMWLSPPTLSAHQVWRHLAQPFTRYRTKGNWVRPRVDIRARMRINSMLYGYNTWIAIKSPNVNGHFKRLLHVEMSRQRSWMCKIRMTVADRQWWRYFLQSCCFQSKLRLPIGKTNVNTFSTCRIWEVIARRKTCDGAIPLNSPEINLKISI